MTRPQHLAPASSRTLICPLAELSDEALVAQLRDGSARAFDTLAARYEVRLLRFCRGILRSTEDAEDALQDVFVSAFRALQADDTQIHLQPWLYQIARNRCINALRRARKVRFEPLDETQQSSDHTVVEAVAAREQLRDLVSDVWALPNTQSTALLLRECDGCPYVQIAAAMNTTVPSVKSLLVRARAGLRASSASRHARGGAHRALTTSERERARAQRTACTVSYRIARAAASSAA